MLSKEKYIPQLYGLRAIACLLVFGIHMFFKCFSFGWIGVDFFFVLSGFLITRVLLSTKCQSTFFREFYKKRALRILPIYMLVLVLVICWSLIMEPGPTFGLAGIKYYLFYLQNIPFIRGPLVVPMAHTWSLGIEEQFYSVWPLLIYLLDIAALKRVLVLAFTSSIIFRVIEPSGMCYIFGCLDGFSTGAFIALFEYEKSSTEALNRTAAYVLIVLIPFLILTSYNFGTLEVPRNADALNPYRWLMGSVYAIMFGGVLTLTISKKFLPQVLSNKALVALGKVSYGFYLYHFTIRQCLLVLDFSKLEVRIWTPILAIAACYFSWKYIEKPIMHWAKE